MMAVLLNVPYAEKDQAKALGAWWNNDLKKWYVPSEKNYYKFKGGFQHPMISGFYVTIYILLKQNRPVINAKAIHELLAME